MFQDKIVDDQVSNKLPVPLRGQTAEKWWVNIYP